MHRLFNLTGLTLTMLSLAWAAPSFAQQPSGTVDLLSLLRELVTLGFEGAGTHIGQIDFGWEICSTGGVPETFTVSSYSITATP